MCGDTLHAYESQQWRGGGETMDDVALFVLQVRIVIDK
jgi:hypothetical protein